MLGTEAENSSFKRVVDSYPLRDLPRELGKPTRVVKTEAENTSSKCVVDSNLTRDLPKELGNPRECWELKLKTLLLNVLLTAIQCVTCPRNWGTYGNAGN